MENIIIVGAGPAGISAALYAARANMDPLVINNGIGALEKAEKIENYYGMEHPVSGKELFETGLAQAKALGVRILEVQVLGIGGFDTFTVKTTAGDFDTISVILATGSKRKAPAIPGIKELEGRGVSYCAVCDAFFYRGKDVAVLGNSDFALHEAEELAPMAGSVTIYTDGKEVYLGRHRLLDAATSDGIPLAAVTLVTANTFRSYERGSQFAWFLGSVLFLLAMLVAATVLSRRFVKPINESLAAVRGDTTEVVTSGISEIDELLTMIRERPVGALPPDVEARLCGFAERANTLTGTERTILQYYMDGYTVKDIPELARISASTVKTHNRNLYRKLGVDSFDELKVYIELFAACGRSGELLKR